jgi:hypothetical protein
MNKQDPCHHQTNKKQILTKTFGCTQKIHNHTKRKIKSKYNTTQQQFIEA